MSNPLFEMQKQSVINARDINFRLDYMRRVEIDGQPEKFDSFVEDIAYSNGSVESKVFSIGNGDVSVPHKKPIGSGVTVVFKDDENNTIANFIKTKQNLIFNEDGTVNLPIDYLFELRIYRIRQDSSEFLEKKWDVYVEENNDYGGDNNKTTEVGTFSVTFKKFKSFGAL